MPWRILITMGVVEFDLERTIKAPIQAVFARLADINGHNELMPRKGSRRPRRDGRAAAG